MMYAIDKYKNHRIIQTQLIGFEEVPVEYIKNERIVKADDDGWVKWYREAVAPLPDNSRYEWKTKGGKKFTGWKPQHLTWTQVAAYRPILDTCTPEEDEAWKEKDMQLNGKEWSGIGFPPAGAMCEAFILSDYGSGDWVECESEGMVRLPCGRFGCVVKTKTQRYLVGAQSEFRPICTEEDKAVEAIGKLIREKLSIYGTAHPVAKTIYRAIKSGDIKL